MKINTPVTPHEIAPGKQDTIITKADLKDIITHANQDFCRISGSTAQELMGKNIIGCATRTYRLLHLLTCGARSNRANPEWFDQESLQE